jgi:DNA-binding transcriptional MerR regulator
VNDGRLRMKDLCAETGLSRQAIHFYIQEGLLPEGDKTGRNMAWYGPEHVERLRLIRRLQEERLLPLKAIRALLAGDTDALPEGQRNLLAEVASQLPAALGAAARDLSVADALARYDVTADELERLIELGLVTAHGDGAHRELGSDAARLLDLWSQFRALGFTRERGFVVDDLVPFVTAAQELVAHETQLLLDRVAHLEPTEVATMIERALPVVHAALVHFHTAAVRAVLTAAQTATLRVATTNPE